MMDSQAPLNPISYKTMRSSPSLSSSSSSSTSFEIGNAACTFTTILRKILCSRGLPTYPEKTEPPLRVAASPGIVARLMGLETLPHTGSERDVSSNYASRSKSMNSFDFRGGSDQQGKRKHRRVKSCQSVVDMPAFFEVENDEFFVLSFESASSTSRMKEDEDSTKKTASRGNKNVVNYDKRSSLVKQKEDLDGVKLDKRKKKKEKPVRSFGEILHEECISSSSPEKASPVSVLDFGCSVTDHESSTSEEDRRSEDYNPRRRLSPELLDCCYQTCKRNDTNLVESDKNSDIITEDTSNRSRMTVCHVRDCSVMWTDIFRLSEEHVIESNWDRTKPRFHEDLEEEIGADLGSQILDLLLDDLVYQLV